MVSMASLYSRNISTARVAPYRLTAVLKLMAKPVVAIPPLRPDAPQPTVWRSKTATLAPCLANSRAADSPVNPAPMIATSTSSGTGVRR